MTLTLIVTLTLARPGWRVRPCFRPTAVKRAPCPGVRKWNYLVKKLYIYIFFVIYVFKYVDFISRSCCLESKTYSFLNTRLSNLRKFVVHVLL